jgi:hypothetical protein
MNAKICRRLHGKEIMNSKERHEKRYERRKAKRDAAKAKRNEGHTFKVASSFGALRRAYYPTRKGTDWKASVQRYGCNILRNSYIQSRRIRNHENISRGFIEFDVWERGKKRHISSVHISERVVQKSFCTNVLSPVIEPTLEPGNAASQKGKGTEYSAQLLIKQLRRHYRKHGNKGYIVIGDGHDYFGSLEHDRIIKNMEGKITDHEATEYVSLFVRAYGGDKGVGLGSETMQISAVAYADDINHYLTELTRVSNGKYMDDWNAIAETKEQAQRILKEMEKKYAERGILSNPKKTQIVKLSHGFIWLQDRYYLTDTGKVIRKPSKKNTTQNRRKLKKLRRMMDEGILTYKEVRAYYGSRKGYYKHKNAHRTKRSMDKLYDELFIREMRNENWNQ